MTEITLNGTRIIIIQDISGSMSSMGDIPREKVNDFIKEQNAENVLVDVWVFNDTYRSICNKKQPLDVNITLEDVYPNGGTALYEAIGNIINITGEELANNTNTRPEKVVVVIFTDGMENSSKGQYMGEKGRVMVKNMIEHQQNVYNWTFFFLGSNIDALQTGSSIGITRDTCINYDSSQNGYDNVFRCTSDAVTRLRSLEPNTDKTTILKQVAFNIDERASCQAVNNIGKSNESYNNGLTRMASTWN